MALEKKYDETPLQVLTDKPTRARVRRCKLLTGHSQASIMRDIIEIGLPMWEEMHGIALDPEVLDGLGE